MEQSIYQDVSRILSKIDTTRDTPDTKALLAQLRNSIVSKNINYVCSLGYLVSYIPEEQLGSGEKLSHYEKAILVAVQMYALHQQSKSNSVLTLDNKYYNLGDSLRMLRSEDSKSIDRRFNIMITSRNFSQLQNQLRQFVKLLKARSDAKVNYAKLADDLYWFLRGLKDNLKVAWSRSYYKATKEHSEGEN
ncbi:type I-E CRISPR-associated protein Cse2/CasB [Umbribacter vaginalis]